APALLLTQSRLGVMSLAVGLVAFGASALVIRSARKRGHAPASGGSSGAGGTRARLIVMAALVLVVGLAAARPVLSRLRASRDQSPSARFRVMTWEGVRAMVAARPVMGSGTGAFDVRYPGYARVGYTQHAHNSFLQVAAETGVPGLALLAAMIAAVLAIGARGLRSVPRADGPDHDALILAGLIAGLIGAIAHNVFDSDLYVPANAAIFGVVCGLTMAFARPATGGRAATARMWPSWARRIPTGMLGAGLLAAGAVAVPARSWIAEASAAMSAGDPYGALDAYRNASKLDPLDHDHRLAMAHVLNGMGEQASARQELVRATRLADIGKTWYRLGKHDLAAGDPASAVRSLERAHRSDPMHLRSRLALAEAYTSSGRRADAVSAYERMIRLYRSPVGRVRAIPEVVDWEYGIAFAGLAEAAIGDGRVAEAADLLDDAASVLRTLWRTRDDVMVRLRVTDDVMREATARYEWVLEQRVACLSRLGRTDLAQSAEAELSRFRQESEAAHGDSPAGQRAPGVWPEGLGRMGRKRKTNGQRSDGSELAVSDLEMRWAPKGRAGVADPSSRPFDQGVRRDTRSAQHGPAPLRIADESRRLFLAVERRFGRPQGRCESV
ncbi:MAG: hypothetical protein FJX72_04265, partial [Armatimonadetes bacterium]|nr:hypothetical protein [Armatimonadota bacterium]